MTQNVDYSAQYLVTYSATGNALTISVPINEWVNSNGQATGSFPVEVINEAQNTLCTFISDDRPASISQPTTITGIYKTQYYLTVNSPYNMASGTGWYDSGSVATVSVDSATASSSSGTRNVFAAWTGDATGTALTSSVLITGPKTVSASWNKEYLVTYSEAGNAISITLPSNEWVVAGAAAQGKFVPSMLDSSGSTQCLFLNDNRTQVIAQPTTINGNYQTQYKVTFTQTGIESDVKGAIVTIFGNAKSFSQLATTLWVNDLATVNFTFENNIPSTIENKVYTLTGTNATSPITINTPTLINGNYRAEYSTSLYTYLGFALIFLVIFLVVVSLVRYRSRRMKKQRSLNEPANSSSYLRRAKNRIQHVKQAMQETKSADLN